MLKKLTALFLCAIMVMGLVPVGAQATETVTVSVSFSMYGELLEDKNGETIANREITLTGKESYTVDDVLIEMHKLYHPEGENAYGSEEATSDWGTYSYITKLWGDTSGKFGYQVNGGTVSTTLDTPMINGDRLDVCIYQNYYPDTEAYTTFDIQEKTVFDGESVTLTLSVAGYDENYNMVFSPLEGATITIDGAETNILTDANGEAEISIDYAGEHIISAKMEKTMEYEDKDDENVPAITAPVCTLTVKYSPESRLLHGMAGAYLNNGFLLSGTNLPWIVSDLAVYAELYPDSENVFGEKLRTAALDKLISDAVSMESPGDLAKTIIAISALGYDAEVVYTSSGSELYLVDKLTALVDAKDADVTNMYTLPYVIVALNEGDWASSTQMEYLVNAAVSTKADWLKTEDMGTDAMTPMLLALAPYYKTNPDVEAALNAAVEILKAEQREEDGLINGFPGYESASTALAICGLSALGIDSSEIAKGGKNLIEGLLNDANEDKTALSNAFATEQGFRALLSYKMLGERMYDFSAYPKEEARATRVSMGGGGGGGGSTVKPPQKEEPEEIPEEVEIDFPDVSEGDWYYEAVAFVCGKGLFKGTNAGFEPNGKMTRAMLVTVLYRLDGENKADEISAFSDVKEGMWYTDAINWATKCGIVTGVSESSFAPDESVTREQLATILYRYAKFLGDDVSLGDLDSFTDESEVSSYAKDAFAFAVASGIVTGKGEGFLAPKDCATRAEVATMLMRYVAE